MPIEYEQTEFLEDIEKIVAACYRENPEMPDYDVLRTYENLLEDYTNEYKERPLKRHNQSHREEALYEAIKEVCERWREHSDAAEKALETDEPPLDLPTIILCFKRLIKSVNRWNKSFGRQAYLEYISAFM